MNTADKINILQDYFSKQKDVRFALLYGSLAKGRCGPLSDVDVAVFFSPDMEKEEMGERQTMITCDLMSLCGINNVDVTILNLANLFLKFQIVKYGKLLKYINKEEFHIFKANVLGEYQDIKPMFDIYAEITHDGFKRHAHG